MINIPIMAKCKQEDWASTQLLRGPKLFSFAPTLLNTRLRINFGLCILGPVK